MLPNKKETAEAKWLRCFDFVEILSGGQSARLQPPFSSMGVIVAVVDHSINGNLENEGLARASLTSNQLNDGTDCLTDWPIPNHCPHQKSD